MLSALWNLFDSIQSNEAIGAGTNDEFPTQLHLFYALARALHFGSSDPPRPALPLEIVIYIMRHAKCLCPPLTLAASDQPASVSSYAGEVYRQRYLISQPLGQRDIYKMERLVVSTTSRDQGWVSDPHSGSYSWFDVAIIAPDDTVKTSSAGTLLLWTSHHNRVAGRNSENLEGVIEGEHEIWDHLSEGDRIAVFIAAQFPGWANYTSSGSLRVWHSFEPTFPLRPTQFS
ncbi:hypothetical protein BOTBODRAFT_34423 [Botryobasidium botryosum FD-172 SS1]|uniref:Uncharacterized protein n=1 Tax=Botryobasidium botryosum (strain FD-172 SS1) TaxID=930990 RepID=A0A067M9L0_BOTB1|nr:hypothetical protein BOTBODRAFT_34423 [Botryobasidium botryosum FD-172 SS1]